MTLAARDGGSSRGLAAVMMRHGSSPVSVGAVRPPDAPAEPPSVAAGNLQGCAYLQASVRTLPGHARPGRRHIFSPAGYSHGQRPTVVNAPFASLHRLQQSRVIVSAHSGEAAGGLWKQAITPAGLFVGREDVAGAQPNIPGPGAAAPSAASVRR